MSAAAAQAPRPGALEAGPEALRWGASLLVILLLHLVVGYYLVALHRTPMPARLPPPESVLIDLAPAPAPAPEPPPPPPPTPAVVPPQPLLPPVTAPKPPLEQLAPPEPLPPVSTESLPPLPEAPSAETAAPPPAEPLPPPPAQILPPAPTEPPAPAAPLAPRLTDLPSVPPPLLRPNIPPVQQAQPAPTKPARAQAPAAQPEPSVDQQPQAQPAAPADYGSSQLNNPIRMWQIAVIRRLHPFMHWPPGAPPMVNQAAPVVHVTIDRQGRILSVRVAQSSGYPVFDHSATRAFKRAETLPPPPPELLNDQLSFDMTMTFTQTY